MRWGREASRRARRGEGEGDHFSKAYSLSLSHYERGGIVDSAAAGGAVSVPVHVVMVAAGPLV